MRTVVDIQVQDTIPDIASVFSGQGIPATASPDQKTVLMAEGALKRYAELARPQGAVMDLRQEEFREVYRGRGQNAAGSPVAGISPKADHLALFVVTVGQALSREIERLFGANDFALGAMLDAAASSGAELSAGALERAWRQRLREEGRLGQGRLFEALKPSDIGVSLNDSFLMQPLKSISGVIVSGQRAIFGTGRSWPACATCHDQNCLERAAALAGQ